MGTSKIEKKLASLSNEEIDGLIELIKKELVRRIFNGLKDIEEDEDDADAPDAGCTSASTDNNEDLGGGIIADILQRLDEVEKRLDGMSPYYYGYREDNKYFKPDFTITCTL